MEIKIKLKRTFGTGKPKYKRLTSQYVESSQAWVEDIYEVEMGNIVFNKKCNDKCLIDKITNWLTNEQVFFYNNDVYIDSNYQLNCDGDIKIEIKQDKIPDFITFNEVKGEFILRGGELVSLRGVPIKVGKRFDCSGNKINTLEYSPTIIGFNVSEGDYCNFNCSNNNLSSLKYSPNVVYGDYFCYNNNLETLEYIQDEINGMLICMNNKITTLKDAPKLIKGDFNVNNNLITSVDNCKTTVIGDFKCKKNLILK